MTRKLGCAACGELTSGPWGLLIHQGSCRVFLDNRLQWTVDRIIAEGPKGETAARILREIAEDKTWEGKGR